MPCERRDSVCRLLAGERIYLEPSLSIIDESQHYFQHCWFFDDHQFASAVVALLQTRSDVLLQRGRGIAKGPGDSAGELVAQDIAVKSMAKELTQMIQGILLALPLMATKIDVPRLPSGVRACGKTAAGALGIKNAPDFHHI